MNIEQLRAFRAVGRLGSVSQAARALFVSQPSLSRTLTRLEREVGTPLLHRRRGSIRLTEAGREFLACSERVLDELDGCLTRIVPARSPAITVSCQVDGLIGPILKQFSLTHPDVPVRELPYSEPDSLDLIRTDPRALAVCTRARDLPGVRFTELHRLPHGILAPADGSLAKNGSATLHDLDGTPLICDSSRLDRSLLETRLRTVGIEPRISYEMQSTELICDLVLEGAGVAVMPLAIRHMVDANPRYAGRLVIVPLIGFDDAVIGIARGDLMDVSRLPEVADLIDLVKRSLEHLS